MVPICQVAEVVLFKQVHRINPQEIPLTVTDQLAPPRDLAPQQAQHRLSLAPAVGDDEDKVIRAGARCGLDGRHLALAYVPVQRPGNPRQAFRARAPGENGELVELAAAHVLASGHCKAPHDAAGIEGAAQNGRSGRSQRVADIRDLESVAQVGLVRAVLQQRLLHVDAREGSWDLDTEHVLPDFRPQTFDQGEHVLFGAEGHLDVQLRDLHDAVRTKIFIAEAARDLVVPPDSRDHQQLLQLLW